MGIDLFLVLVVGSELLHQMWSVAILSQTDRVAAAPAILVLQMISEASRCLAVQMGLLIVQETY